MKSILAAACAAVLTFAGAAQGQALADRVPADAILYVGWAGADALGSSYGQTHLKAVMDQSKVGDLFGRYLDEVEARATKAAPQAKESFRVARLFAAPLWRHPTAMYVAKPELPAGGPPKVRLAILSRAGERSAALADELNALLAKVPQSSVPVRAFAIGDVVCLAVGYESGEMALAGTGRVVAMIGAAPAFVDALKQVAAKPAVVTFVNAAAVVDVIEDAAEMNDPQAKAKVTAFLDASGLRGVKSYVSTGGFDGADWVERSFVSAPGEKAGLLASMPAGAADAALLSRVPEDATFFASTRFDAFTLVRATQAALAKTDPQARQYFDMGLSAMQQALGTNVAQNILEPLGSDWAAFASPRVGSGLLGLVAVNKLDDPEKLRKGLRTASVNLTNWINVAINKNGNPGGLSIHGATTKVGDVNVHYLALPIAAPSWAIHDGALYLGLYPQTVGAAIRQAGKGGKSIVDSAKYQTLMKRLDAPAGTGTYYDLPTSAAYGPMYPQLMALVRYAGIGDLWGVTLPEPLLPPIDVLLDHLAPAGSASWVDELGFHTKSVTPFPGAKLLSEQGAVATAGVGGGALATSILLPSLNRARETANRVKSASNLRQIGMGMMLYANENRGAYPPDLETLLNTQDLVPEVFVSPRTDNAIPAEVAGDVEAAINYAANRGDYVYLGAGLKNDEPAETVVAYERPDALEDGINVLFADGHVDFFFMDAALELIASEKDRRGLK